MNRLSWIESVSVLMIWVGFGMLKVILNDAAFDNTFIYFIEPYMSTAFAAILAAVSIAGILPHLTRSLAPAILSTGSLLCFTQFDQTVAATIAASIAIINVTAFASATLLGRYWSTEEVSQHERH